jgi:TusA-related sulfurtransferase
MNELDLREVTCPLTWVRTKLALEAMAPGDELRVLLGTEEARENVPRSAREAGHAVSVRDDAVLIRKL